MTRLSVGTTASETKRITHADILAFAEVSGDFNPIHIDRDVARAAGFPDAIAHGMFGATLISKLLGNDVPGPGTIYLAQSLRFRAPVIVGDVITARVTVTGKRDDKPIYTLATECLNQRGEVVIDGEATVLRKTTEAA